MDDSQIVDLFWNRSDRAVEETEKKYGSYCRYIAFHVLGDREDSAECVNDALLKAWDLIPPNRPEALSGFLGKLTRNLALDRLRANTAQKRGGGQVAAALEELTECVSDPSQTEDRAIDSIVLSQALEQFLDSQREEDRIIFVRRYWYLNTVKEIAADLGCSQSRVKMSLLRTRQALGRRLKEEGIPV